MLLVCVKLFNILCLFHLVMKKFDFSNNIIKQVIDEIEKAKTYIKIAIFQIHNDSIIDKLVEKVNGRVSVEIITLPYDSINEDVREHVTKRLEELRNAGATLSFCKWNVGDPERTTTAVGRWYSFHGKFMVTDKAAVSLSANLTNSPELDASLIFDDEENKIKEFNEKFEELKELFITKKDGYDGNIRRKILDTNNPRAKDVFEVPRSIRRELHGKNWILHYPPELCPENIEIEEKLYITPFDCRGRNFIMDIIKEAEEFVYISTESFTDKEFPNFLKKIKFRGIDIKILTGYMSMDFSDRMQIFMKELLAAGISLNTTLENLHAKLIITDKLVALSSINLNNMNLGFKKTGGFWRENTETIIVCRDPKMISDAKGKYTDLFDASEKIIDKIAEKNAVVAGKLFKRVFDSVSSADAKKFLAKISIEKEIEKEKVIYDIVKEALRLKEQKNLNKITKELLEEAINNIS